MRARPSSRPGCCAAKTWTTFRARCGGGGYRRHLHSPAQAAADPGAAGGERHHPTRVLCPTHAQVEMLCLLKAQPRIVQLKATYEDRHAVHLVLEYCAGGACCSLCGRRMAGWFGWGPGPGGPPPPCATCPALCLCAFAGGDLFQRIVTKVCCHSMCQFAAAWLSHAVPFRQGAFSEREAARYFRQMVEVRANPGLHGCAWLDLEWGCGRQEGTRSCS